MHLIHNDPIPADNKDPLKKLCVLRRCQWLLESFNIHGADRGFLMTMMTLMYDDDNDDDMESDMITMVDGDDEEPDAVAAVLLNDGDVD